MNNTAAESIYTIPVQTINGELDSLERYRGQVLLIVNVASRCGFTPQYQGLEELQQHFSKQGFSVLGFPCNQFGAQEPGNEAEIKNFCEMNYKISFPLFAKIDVNGDTAHPLYQFLKERCPGLLGTEAIKWNFTKFLIDRQGQPVARFAPSTTPSALLEDIERQLK